MYSSDVKFEEYRLNIFRGILDGVLYYETTYDVITLLKNTNISKTKTDILKRKIPFFYTLNSLSNKQQLFFTSQAL